MTDIAQQRISALEKKVGPTSKSPLFAQLAAYYLEAGRPKDALRICDQGLANYPFYTTGHLVKGRALVALNMKAEARREFEFVHEFLPANDTVAKLLADVPPGAEESPVELPPPPESEIAQVEVAQPEVASAKVIEPEALQPEVVTETPSEQAVEFAPTPTPTDDFGMGTSAPVETPPQPTPVEETPPAPANLFEAFGQTTEASSADDAFGLGGASPTAEAPPPSQPEAAPAEPNPFDAFNLPSEPSTSLEPAPAEPVPSESPFDSFPTAEPRITPPPPPSEEELFEQYAAKMRPELAGENSMTLDQYLNSQPPQPAPSAPDTIEALTEKLQTAKKITPVINFAEKSTPLASESDTPAGSGFVTPTLAEIYAKQGWYDDAMKAYKTLILTKPSERERFEKRIAELEELKKQQG